VDTSIPGTYTVTYTVTDAASNTTSIGRIVTVNAAISADTYTINVTASNASDYTLSGADRNGNVTGNDPSVTVNVGDTIDFAVDASGHPFYIKTVQATGTDDLAENVTNNGATDGTVSWTPTATGTYYYQCSLHNAMNGTITVN
jgi:plastocyanin